MRISVSGKRARHWLSSCCVRGVGYCDHWPSSPSSHAPVNANRISFIVLYSFPFLLHSRDSKWCVHIENPASGRTHERMSRYGSCPSCTHVNTPSDVINLPYTDPFTNVPLSHLAAYIYCSDKPRRINPINFTTFESSASHSFDRKRRYDVVDPERDVRARTTNPVGSLARTPTWTAIVP